jgi:beta-lactamase regulating signal transducer with metallopeptidase domain
MLFKTLLLQSAIGAILTLVLLLKPVTQRIFGNCWQYYI